MFQNPKKEKYWAQHPPPHHAKTINIHLATNNITTLHDTPNAPSLSNLTSINRHSTVLSLPSSPQTPNPKQLHTIFYNVHILIRQRAPKPPIHAPPISTGATCGQSFRYGKFACDDGRASGVFEGFGRVVGGFVGSFLYLFGDDDVCL